MNAVKELGELIGSVITELKDNDELDQRWIAMANTNLQTGIMFAIRGIAQPTSY